MVAAHECQGLACADWVCLADRWPTFTRAVRRSVHVHATPAGRACPAWATTRRRPGRRARPRPQGAHPPGQRARPRPQRAHPPGPRPTRDMTMPCARPAQGAHQRQPTRDTPDICGHVFPALAGDLEAQGVLASGFLRLDENLLHLQVLCAACSRRQQGPGRLGSATAALLACSCCTVPAAAGSQGTWAPPPARRLPRQRRCRRTWLG